MAQGPFTRSSAPRPFSLYRPDFFLKDKRVWIHPNQSVKLDSKQLYDFLFPLKTADKNQKKGSNSFSHIDNLSPKLSNSFKIGIDSSSTSSHSSQAFKSLFQLKSSNFKSLQQDLKEEGGFFEDFFSQSQKPNFISYQQCFIQVKRLIKQKKLEKIVPVFPEVFLKKASPLKFLQRLFQNTFFLEGYLYGLWDKHSGVLGFTPELLFQLQKDSFTTMALAGTALQNSSSLLKDQKQIKEHEFVVKGLKESLKNHIHWKSEKKSEMVFPPLKHLRTDLKGSLVPSHFKLSNISKRGKQTHKGRSRLSWSNPAQNNGNQQNTNFFESFCRLLHPSSAVGGYPKKSAQDWLKQEPSQKNRKFYSAPFGFYESCEEFFCLVALRNLQWNQKKSFLFSGAGWIAESSLQEEWRELSLKREQVKSFFTYCQKDFERVFSKT